MKTKSFGSGLMFALWIPFFSGCAVIASSDIKQKDIYTHYTVSFDANTRKAEFKATFTVGGSIGTYVSLDGTSQVTLDSSVMKMERDIINQVYYDYEWPGLLESDLNRVFTFDYRNNDGATYVNSVQIPAEIQFRADQSTTVTPSRPFTVHWETTVPLKDDEGITATIENHSQGGMASASSQGASGNSGDIVFQSDRLSSLRAGWGKMTLCRGKFVRPSQAPEAGGSISTSYCGISQEAAIQN